MKHMKPITLAGLGLAAFGLAACVAARATPTAIVSGPSALSIAVASNDFGVGAPRVPFIIFKGPRR